MGVDWHRELFGEEGDENTYSTASALGSIDLTLRGFV